MLSWFFKKRGDLDAPPPAPAPPVSAQAQAESRAKQAEDARALWLPRLQSAQGDDAALLRVAQDAPVLEIKLAAVEALATEESLKQAERELRNHDRRAHRAAKQRLATAVAQREARTAAQALIEAATALTGDVLLPANRLVALDRDWQALDASLLDTAQHTEFNALRERLNTLLRERGEQQQQLQRWTTDATRVLAELQSGCSEAAASGDRGDLATHVAAAQALRVARPEEADTAALDQALQAALQTAAQLEARLAWLAALDLPRAEPAPQAAPAEPAPADAAESESPPTEIAAGAEIAAVEAPATPSPAERWQEWQALPPLADGELARLLDQRFAQWQRAQAPEATAAPARKPRAAPATRQAPSREQLQQVDALLQAAEAALAEGHLEPLQQHLQASAHALDALHGLAPGDRLRARHHALQAEHARLKDWQQWGGARALDDLVAEAEELARLTLAAAEPEAPKLRLKPHAESVHALRARWKELERLGTGASQALWQRFDAALQTAYQPVAAQQTALKATRLENLAAREALLATLDAVPELAASATADDVAAHWKELGRLLDRFHLAWRQLGPLEHTVPSAAKNALQQRLRSSVERVEAPLQEARRVAEGMRQQLIARAEALAQDLGRQPLRDVGQRVRELQAEWQHHARALTLNRAVESALWSRFKAATDAVFAQREAVFSAREAELAANLVAREALLERLSALADDSPASEIQRTLAEVDQAWRQDIELPRAAVGAIETRFRNARAAALQLLAGSAQKRWQAQCDTLATVLALCEERESAPAGDSGLAERWAAHTALPAAWQQPLAQRWAQPPGPGPLPEAAVEGLLLQLEMALNLPFTPEQQAARRELKLRAMKDALEGRGAQKPEPALHAEWLAAALRQGGLNPVQRERLQGLIAALRRAPPGALGSPVPRG